MARMESDGFSIDTSRLIGAILRHVPGCYVRDYRDNGGHLNVCRGYRELRGADGTVLRAIPAETLCSLPRGYTTASALYVGMHQFRPGWRLEMRKAAKYITPNQRRRIEKDLGQRVFTGIRE